MVFKTPQGKTISRLLLCLMIGLLAGCDSIPFIDQSSEYKGAGRGKPLEVPPDLTSVTSSDTYSVPGSATYSDYANGKAVQPEEVKLLPTLDGVKIERAGSQRWLVVNAPPEKIWPVVRDFWTELGFAVRIENMQSGVMETEWIDPSSITKDDNGNYLDKFQGWLDKLNTLQNRQKFRTRIDRGSESNVTEIYMSHRSISDIKDDGKERVRTVYGEIENGYKLDTSKKQVDNSATAGAEDLDAELLRRLMVKLGVEEKKSKTLIAQPNQEKRATISQEKSGLVTLALNDPFDRAWRRVGLSLDRIGFVVEDKDRSSGLFFVRYSAVDIDTGPKKEKGLLDNLKFWGNDEEDKADKEEIPKPKKDDDSLVDKLKFWEAKDKTEAAEKQYRVKLEKSSAGTNVVVVDKAGARDNSQVANRILAMLYEQLK